MKKTETLTLSVGEAQEAFKAFLSRKLECEISGLDFPEPTIGFKLHPTADYCTLIVNRQL